MRVSRPLLLLMAAVVFVPGTAGDVTAQESAWARKLAKNDATEIYRVIEEIAERQDISGGRPLLDAGVAATAPHLAVACGEALSKLKPEEVEKHLFRNPKFMKRFRKLMDDKDVDRQKNMARVLGAWGDPFVDEHLAHLAKGRREASVQTEALFMAGSLVETKKHKFNLTRDEIAKALKKGRSGEIQAAACSAAGRRKMRGTTQLLESIIRRSKDDYAGLYAVWALSQIGWDGGIGSFVHVATKNPKKETLQACLKAITELSTVKDVDDLLSLTRSSKKDLRDAGTLALGRLYWRAARKARDAKVAKDGEVATGADEAGKVRGGLADSEVEIPDRVIDRLITIVKTERTWEVRDAARQGLLRFGEKARAKVQAEMPEAVRSSDDDTALTGMELCGLFDAHRAYPDLLKTALHDHSRVRRMFAARALGGVKPDQAVKDLTEGIKRRKKAKDFEMRAVRALGYIRHADAYNYLVGMFSGSDAFTEEMLREAEYALERLTAHRFGRKPKRWAAWYAKSKNPFEPRAKILDRKKNRRDAVEKRLYGLTPETENAVEAGLRWLEYKQHAIGSWDGNDRGMGGVIGCEPAYTGLAVLSMVGAGYNGAEGKYRETIRRATEFLAATQFYDGGFPVTGGGDSSWIFAYLISMGIWGITESYALSGDELFEAPAQWGIDYLVRVQTSGGGWRYGPRYHQSDTSCTSWVLMTTKMADLVGLHVAQRSWDGIDDWLERCQFDITGQEEIPKDLATDYDFEVGSRRYYKAFTGYLELSEGVNSALQQNSMTAVGMVCRFFMGWKRSHPFMIGSANYLLDHLPRWMEGLGKGMAIAWFHYYWYYGTLAMHQMGGRYWRAWNQKIKKMYPDNQCKGPASLAGSWDPDTAKANGGRLFSTSMSIMALETYYRFSPLLDSGHEEDEEDAEDDGTKDDGKKDDGQKDEKK